MRHLSFNLVVALCLALAAGAAAAQRNLSAAPAAAGEQRVALVIGNSSYKESPLANPVNDATDMASALQSLGFKVILRRNAGTRDMRQAIREFGSELRRAQVGLFYFAGHGVQVRGNNYLVPVGADMQNEADVEDLAIDANFALRTMEEAQVKVSIAILDACRNNPFARSFRSAARGLALMNAATGSLVAFATAPGSTASDGSGRNGIYTKHLLANLRQGDPDIAKVFQRTRAGVVKETGGKQTPWESTSLVGDFYFRPPAGGTQVAAIASVPAVPVDPAANDRAVWTSIDQKNPDELKAYLDQFPRGVFASVARTRLKSLESTQVAIARPPAAVAPAPPLLPPGSIAGMSRGRVFRDCADCPEMVVIPAGRFTMGSPASEPGRYENEGPQHQVTISRPFAAGKYEVTFDEWDACARDGGCSQNPGDQGWGRGKRPVINVSWQDAKQYTEWLSRKTGKSYRLLTEAEWEYVARAGTSTAFSFGNSITPQQANYETSVSYAGSSVATTPRSTVPVGSYAPNAFGLYDVHGNVWEWTEDCWNSSYSGAPSDGSAWSSGECGRRVLRGGAWSLGPQYLRSANRDWILAGYRYNVVGLRLARTD